MILYHGTSIRAWENIRSTKVDATINADTELDFGHGFYGSFAEDILYTIKHVRKTTRGALGLFNIRKNSVIIEFEIDESLFVNPRSFDTVDIAMRFYRVFRRKSVEKFVKWNYGLPFNKYRQVVLKTQDLCDKIVIRKVTNLKGDVLYEKQKENN